MGWTTLFKLVDETPLIKAYLDRFNARAAVKTARLKEEQLVADQEKTN